MPKDILSQQEAKNAMRDAFKRRSKSQQRRIKIQQGESPRRDLEKGENKGFNEKQRSFFDQLRKRFGG